MKSVELRKIKEKLKFLEGNYDGVAYGSYVEGEMRPDSDIDVTVLSHETNKDQNIKLQKELLGKFPLKYDIRIFELLPIYIYKFLLLKIIGLFLVIHSRFLNIFTIFARNGMIVNIAFYLTNFQVITNAYP